MNQEFLEFLNALMEAAPEVATEKMTDNIKTYIDILKNNKSDKPEITDNGKLILDYMQKSEVTALKSKDIADGLLVSSRTVSGSMRKLVTDGFVEKMGQNPAIYTLTDKGKNYQIN
jgi:DNA-binding MarR family transcriptional regulator